MNNIKKTKDYEIFNKHESNRPIDKVNLKKIINSIKAQNLLEFRPILVNAEMQVIDGQHRLEAAKGLGLEVYYQIDSQATHEHIVLLNQAQKKWELNDYVNYYASLGNFEYIKLKEYSSVRGLTVNAVTLLIGVGQTKRLIDIKKGEFVFPDNDQMHKLNETLDQYDKIKAFLKKHLIVFKRIADSFKLRTAIIRLLNNPDVDYDTLMNKLSYRSDIISPKIDVSGYYYMLKDIYNWKNQTPLP